MNYKSIFYFIFLTIVTNSYSQFRVRTDEFVQIGYDDYRVLTFGDESSNPLGNNGKWALEHYNSGLNFWIPWPAAGNGNYKLFLRDDGNVAIGSTGSSSHKLTVNGAAIATQWYTYSDERLKKDIKPINNGLNKVKQLKPVSYKYDYDVKNTNYKIKNTSNSEVKNRTLESDAKNHIETRSRNGFLAQDLKEVMPESVVEAEDGVMSINYNDIIPLLVESIQEQQQIIENLEDKLESLEINTNNKRMGNDLSGNDNELNVSTSQLFNNYPNPFNNTTEISFYLSEKDIESLLTAVIDIYNAKGILVKSIPLSLEEGENKVTFSRDSLSPGIYAYSLNLNGDVIDTETMIITE